jgi:hypothetical protein
VTFTKSLFANGWPAPLAKRLLEASEKIVVYGAMTSVVV